MVKLSFEPCPGIVVTPEVVSMSIRPIDEALQEERDRETGWREAGLGTINVDEWIDGDGEE